MLGFSILFKVYYFMLCACSRRDDDLESKQQAKDASYRFLNFH
jgi:hypothetical protein